VKGEGDDLDQQSNIFEFGLNYDSTIDDLRLRADIVYLMAENELPSDTTITPASPWVAADLSEWGGALSVKYEGFTFGGAYRHSNARGGFIDHAPVVLTGGASDTEIWSVGALYEFDSWKIGANYTQGETNVAVEAPGGGVIGTQDGEAWQIAAAYAVDSDIQIAAGFQRYSFDAAPGLNPLGLAEFRPVGVARSPYVGDLEADILFTEVSFGF
jgi:predicted porin